MGNHARRRPRSGGGSAGTSGGVAAAVRQSIADVGGRRAPYAVQWWSNAPWAATGYGVQTAQVVERLQRDGYLTSVSNNYGLEATSFDWHGVTVYPRGFDAYSQDVIVAHWEDWQRQTGQPTVLVTLYDTWVLKNPRLAQIPVIASWVPIDHQPAPVDVLGWCAQPNVVPVAMAEFGQRMLRDAGIDCEYVPHGIDCNVLKPTADLNGVSGRQLMKAPADAFVVAMNAANKGVMPNRKRFAEQFLAVAELQRRHADVWLYVHTDELGGAGGINLAALAEATGVDTSRVTYPAQYSYRMGIPPEGLAAIYTAADVLVACSAGEGFGIPVVEAQACGTRVVVSDFTAQPELVGDGWTVAGQPDWDPMQKAWFFTPHIGAIVEALEDAYNHPGHSAKAVEFARRYDNDVVYNEHWRPVLDRLGATLAERLPL